MFAPIIIIGAHSLFHKFLTKNNVLLITCRLDTEQSDGLSEIIFLNICWNPYFNEKKLGSLFLLHNIINFVNFLQYQFHLKK